MATTILGSATIKIVPDSSGFSAALQGQLKGVGGALANAFGSSGGGGAVSNFNQSLRGLSDQLGRTSNRMIGMGEAMTYGITRPLIGLAKSVVDTAAEFDQSMKFIQAASRTDLSNPKGVENLKAIRDLAISMGREGKFSAGEMASAFEVIARSGADTDGTAEQLRKRIEGLGNTVRQVAEIEKTDMASATQSLVEVFTGFGGSLRNAGEFAKHLHADLGDVAHDPAGLSKEFTRMGDILTTVSVNSVNSITDLSNAFRYAGPVASAAGMSFEDTAAALGVLGEAGFKGTVGGTALRGIITRLTAASKQSQDELAKLGLSADEAFGPQSQANIQMTSQELTDMQNGMLKAGVDGKSMNEVLTSISKNDFAKTAEEMSAQSKNLGIELFDAGGKMKPLSQILPIFQAKLADGTMRIGDVMKLLGQRAGPAFIALLKNVPLYETLTGKTLDAADATDKFAKTIEQGATIQLLKMKNAFKELAISIGDSGVLDFFTTLAGNVTEFTHKLAESDPQIFKWIAIVGGLVAAMGPLRVVLGLVGSGFNSFIIKPLIMMTSPLGVATIAIGALIGFFALMVAKSEPLRAALESLGKSVSAFLVPAFEELVQFGKGVIAVVAALAGYVGNLLAPKILELSKTIMDFVADGSLTKWFSDRIENVKNLALALANMWMDMKDNGTFTAIHNAIERVWNDVLQLRDALWPIVEDILPALQQVGKSVFTTIGAVFGAVVLAGKGFLSVIEKLFGPIKSIADILGGVLGPILTFLIARFVLMRGSFIAAATGIPALVGVVAGLANGMANLGISVDAAGKGFANFITPLEGTTFAASGLGQVLGNIGARVQSTATKVGEALFKIGGSLEKAGINARNAAAGIQAAVSGFMMGTMAAQADTMAQKFTSLGTLVAGMATSIAMMPGPLGMVMALVQGITFLIGMWVGHVEDTNKAMLNMDQTLTSIAASMEQAGQATLTSSGFILEYKKALDGLSPENFAIIDGGLKKLGSSTQEFGEALVKGGPAADEFINKIQSRFTSGVLDGSLHSMDSLTASVTQFSRTGNAIEGHQTAWKDLSKDVQGAVNPLIEVKNKAGDVIGTFSNMDQVTKFLGDRFKDDFKGQTMIDFANQVDLARKRFEALKPIIEADRLAQEDLKERSKSWADKVADANNEYSKTKGIIANILAPQDDLTKSVSDLFDTLRSNLGASQGEMSALAKATGGTFQAPTDTLSPEFKVWLDFIDQGKTKLNSAITELQTKIPLGPPDAMKKTFEDQWATEVETIKQGIINQFHLTPEQAQSLLDNLMPSGEQFNAIESLFGTIDTNSPIFKEQADALRKNLMLSFSKELKGMNLGDVEYNILTTLDIQTAGDMPKEMAMKLLEGINNPSINKDQLLLDVQGNPPQGMTWDQVNFLLAGGVIDIGHLHSLLTVATSITAPEGMDPNIFATLLASLTQQGMKSEDIQKTITFTAQFPPDQQGLIEKLLMGGEGTSQVNADLNVIAKYNLDVNASPEDLQGLLSLAKSGGVLHSGGIVGGVGGTRNVIASPVLPDEQLTVLQIGEAVLSKDVVDKLGVDAIQQLISGAIPTAALQISLTVTIAMLGAGDVSATFLMLSDFIVGQMDMIAMIIETDFSSAADAAIQSIDLIQSAMGIAAIVMTTYIGTILMALNMIPSVMSAVAASIQSGFSGPINFIEHTIWPHFAEVLNGAATSFGLGAVIPVFHDGGIVGEDGSQRSLAGGLSSDEMMALLQKGEGVMSQEMMASMTQAQMTEFRRGNPRWFAVGGPYEAGQGYVNAHASANYGTYDLDAMKASYEATVKPLLGAMQAQYASNIVAQVGGAAVDKIANGAFDWVKGADDAATAQQIASIGLPPGFDLKGSLPANFDLSHWREFLGANKAPGDWPLITKYLDAAQIPYLINSTFRPGGHSYHASGRAVDLGAPGDANFDSPGLLKINHALAPLLGVLAELIYAGPGGITDKAYDAETMAGHHNHVHAALAKGGIIQSAMHALLGEAGPEVLLPLNDPSRALDIAMSSNLLSVLADAAAMRSGTPSYGPSPLGNVSRGGSPSQTDTGFLGGGPGNTYNIYGVDLAHVKTEIKNRDKAVMRVRR